jgi:hypothetical protein
MRKLLLCVLSLLVAGLSLADEPAPTPTLIAKPAAFPTLVNPNCSHCRDEAKRRAKDLRDDDRVLCWIRGYSDGGAIPYRFFLNPYRVISDTYGVFVYDPDAGFARGFEKSLDFRFHGWRNGIMVMKHKDGTLYSCLSGLAFDGPKKGTRLKAIPTLVSDWGYWLKTYPHAVAYHMFDKYQAVELATTPNADSVKSRGPVGERAEEAILGVVEGKSARAYPLKSLAREGLIRETVGGKDRVVLWFPPTKTAAAYGTKAQPPEKSSAAPRNVTLEGKKMGKETVFVDRETGSRWDIAGRAVDGQLKGWTLPWLDGTQVKWFAWKVEYPDTSISK